MGRVVQWVEREGLAKLTISILIITTAGCLAYTWGYAEGVHNTRAIILPSSHASPVVLAGRSDAAYHEALTHHQPGSATGSSSGSSSGDGGGSSDGENGASDADSDSQQEPVPLPSPKKKHRRPRPVTAAAAGELPAAEAQPAVTDGQASSESLLPDGRRHRRLLLQPQQQLLPQQQQLHFHRRSALLR